MPGDLSEARSIFARLPPLPPSRNTAQTMTLQPKKLRQCKGCHGFGDESHSSIPMGADKCSLDHDRRCSGDILGGLDKKGRMWRACPADFIPPVDKFVDCFGSDADSLVGSGSEDMATCSLSEKTKISQPLVNTTTSISTSNSVSGAQSLLSTATVSSASQKTPISSALQDSMADELAALDRVRAERKALEEQIVLQQQQEASAQRLELRRQLQAEQDMLDQVKSNAAALRTPSSISDAVNTLRSKTKDTVEKQSFTSYYEGPNIRDIRKLPGLGGEVENTVETIRGDVHSLGRRPTAGEHHLGARSKHSSRQPLTQEEKDFQEYKEFQSWRARLKSVKNKSESESDASPPRAVNHRSSRRQKSRTRRVSFNKPAQDDTTGPSSSEDESSQPVILVYRRDANGVKYRTYEPYLRAEPVQTVQQYVWKTDPESGRQYKQPVGRNSKHPGNTRLAQTPAFGFKSGEHSPSSPRRGPEHVPGIIPLSEKEGKKESLAIVDWARNCPVAYAEKIKYDELNLPLWVWAYVAEILSSRSGLSPEMPEGQLEARLQHLLCVLQVALVNSEKTDYFTNGWSVASTYAKRVQQKLDRKLENWSDFKRFGHDPHPSEMISAKTEVDRKVPVKKKKEFEKNDQYKNEQYKTEQSKKLCTTWNTSDTQRKCQYMLDNHGARCIRRHECSYCSEKGYGVNVHQRRFCRKRLDAGDE